MEQSDNNSMELNIVTPVSKMAKFNVVENSERKWRVAAGKGAVVTDVTMPGMSELLNSILDEAREK